MKIFSGVVISTKMAKTAVVKVNRVYIHPKYKKRLVRSKKFHVHDEVGVNVGDKVRFVEVKPVSKTKRWKIVKVT
ncbi:30S ribosomal protein S17 [Candidatus Woesebacteria bacterium RIFCSPHIGHO2_02_FULL_38_9]|uniref:Small ribosomal subunit protein uS17 n=1 Tax=Candidatus Woesebacteria bacterium RIFCSPHIGHO2_01_FULL_39_28 TaxID=1802496 RepID=A0A1F7YC48_9BACT|nr:MAG: 30S ribosomal protein S17 [Candidatus Woesebacteria bacterium RIFCSPHIGHO2_01_FULL_39_28]OGM32243.1 MAG: 30S ribosomal protein S17 [Candidatus Woesebacteria bacterium RIFCSPHIGHO2_02_FULL_38_9]OGM58466.1 MAG: 30S ribosomal protein S17 [Candidatus Woesebacteria bacterium RIFCSPLOWO2_01_FULL_38_20]